MRSIASAASYLWSLPYGRLALMITLIGAIGLTARYWTAAPLLLTLPRLRDEAR